MDTAQEQFNELLVETYRNILKVEQNMMRSDTREPLSIAEVHAIEVVSKAGESTISDIGRELDITPATVTATVDRLEKKGYVRRRRSWEDRRVVFVQLTDMGRKIDRIHKMFHARMVAQVLAEFTEEEKRIMLQGAEKLNMFFKNAAHKNNHQQEAK
jgi:DNA-binding MarR family transcriptional regulator